MRAVSFAMLLEWLAGWFKQFPRARAGGASDAGAAGERAAERFLCERHGYEVVARNWRHGRDEIDLICRDGDVMVFVEVKARSAGALVPGYYSVDRRKKKALRRVIHAFLTSLKSRPRTFRFDIVEVELVAGRPDQVLVFENIPLFSKGYHVVR
jgi:putative endonuclease